MNTYIGLTLKVSQLFIITLNLLNIHYASVVIDRKLKQDEVKGLDCNGKTNFQLASGGCKCAYALDTFYSQNNKSATCYSKEKVQRVSGINIFY